MIADVDSPIFEWCGLCLASFVELGVLKHPPYDIETLGDTLRSEFSNARAQAFGMLELYGWTQIERPL